MSSKALSTTSSRPSSDYRGRRSCKTSPQPSIIDDVSDISPKQTSRKNLGITSGSVKLRGRSTVVRQVGLRVSSKLTLDTMSEKCDFDCQPSSGGEVSLIVRRSNLETKVMAERRTDFRIGRSVESIRRNPSSWLTGMSMKFATEPVVIFATLNLLKNHHCCLFDDKSVIIWSSPR